MQTRKSTGVLILVIVAMASCIGAAGKSKSVGQGPFVLELGPRREPESRGFFSSTPRIYARKKTFKNGTESYEVRLTAGEFAANFDPNVISKFLAFAEEVKQRKQELSTVAPAVDTYLKLDLLDLDGDELTLSYSYSDHSWRLDDAQVYVVKSFADALKDVDELKKRKATTPW